MKKYNLQNPFRYYKREKALNTEHKPWEQFLVEIMRFCRLLEEKKNEGLASASVSPSVFNHLQHWHGMIKSLRPSMSRFFTQLKFVLVI